MDDRAISFKIWGSSSLPDKTVAIKPNYCPNCGAKNEVSKMKVKKHGDIVRKRIYKFKCINCGCKYIAESGECAYCDEYGYPETNPTDYVMCRCPECDKSNRIQWRIRFNDWYDRYHNLLLTSTALLGALLFFLFMGVGHWIIALISLFISVVLFGIILEI